VKPEADVPPTLAALEEDIWEDSDEPSGRSPQATERPTATPPENLPERRVVVIDEDAEFRASHRLPNRRSRQPEEPGSPAGAVIGATLEEEGQGKRRWRLFRKGGE
jgi:hypothetical protein